MKTDFPLRGRQLKGCIPRSALQAIESPTARTGMSKGGVHDVCQTKSGNQFDGADAGQPATFAEQAIVGCSLQFGEIAEQVVVALSDAIEHGTSAIAVAVRNETVGPVAFDEDLLGNFHRLLVFSDRHDARRAAAVSGAGPGSHRSWHSAKARLRRTWYSSWAGSSGHRPAWRCRGC